MTGRRLVGCVALLLLSACSGETTEGPGAQGSGGQGNGVGPGPVAGSTGTVAGATGSGTGGTAGTGDPGAPVAPEGETVDLQSPQEADAEALLEELETTDELSTEELLSRYESPLKASLPYDPSEALGLDTINASALSLSDAESEVLLEHGLVISDRQAFTTFVNGYTAIYSAHLPVFVSADSILNAVHLSYDAILEALETTALIPTLRAMLNSMQAALENGRAAGFGPDAEADADLYVSVAKSLLAGELVDSAGFAANDEVLRLYESAAAADGYELLTFFGAERYVDFSQFLPRGHYNNSEELGRYFRAMSWLGLADLRLIETQPDGSSVFHRRQLELAYALGSLLDAQGLEYFSTLDDTIRIFVGESDNMTPLELDSLLADLGLGSAEELQDVDSETIAQAIVDGGYGTQQISGHWLQNNTLGEIPLSSVFLVLGKRYVVDSHVFSNVVYGRVPDHDGRLRMMPDPLDVAFAALGNNQAALLLESELDTYAYAPELAKTRQLVDAHPDSFWDKNLYNDWLSALRALSPEPEASDTASAGLPSIAGTEAWGRRLLNTQLASWAELRHDTLLYAKQSYTDAPSCEFPDAYVEPYPEFFEALSRFAAQGREAVENLPVEARSLWGTSIAGYFTHLEQTMQKLATLAEHQRTGTAYSGDELEFINNLVTDGEGCFVDPDGWYPQLVLDAVGTPKDSEFDPTIADVHTQPTDEGGNPVGKILHVGTGPARLLVVTADTCSGPRAYVGLASSYFERITEDFERLTDDVWAEELMEGTPEDVPWLADVVAR